MRPRMAFFVAFVLVSMAFAETPRLVVPPPMIPPKNEIKSVAVSPDGRLVAASGAGGSLFLWESATGGLLRHWWGHTSEAYSVRFSPDGRFLLSGGEENSRDTRAPFEGTAKLWDVTTGLEAKAFRRHLRAVNSAEVSADGRSVVTGGDDGSAKLWDAQTGHLIRVLTDEADRWVSSVAFSVDGRLVATASNRWEPWNSGLEVRPGSFRVDLWDSATGKRRGRLLGHADAVTSVAFSPDGSRLLTGSKDKTMRLWDIRSGNLLRRFNDDLSKGLFAAQCEVTAVALSPVSNIAAMGESDGTIRLWDVSNGKVLRRLEGHGPADTRLLRKPRCVTFPSVRISSLQFSPDGSLLISGGSDGTVRAWRTDSGNEFQRFRSQEFVGFQSAGFSPDGRFLVGDGSDGKIHVWDLVEGEEARRVPRPSVVELQSSSPKFSPEDMLAFVLRDGFSKSLTLDHKGVRVIRLSPNGLIFTGGFFGDIGEPKPGKLWSATGELVRELDSGRYNLVGAAFSPDGSLLYTSGLDPDEPESSWAVQVWRVPSGELQKAFPGVIAREISVSPDGGTLLVVPVQQSCGLWSADSGRELMRLRDGDADCLAGSFSVSGDLALTGENDGTARLWEASTGRLLARLPGHGGPVRSVAFSRDDRVLATAGSDGVIRLWSRAGTLLSSLYGLITGEVWFVVDPEGRFDSNRLEDLPDIRMVLPSEPLRSDPFEPLLRSHYEPRLLSKILNGSPLRPVKSLDSTSLNTPRIKIGDIRLRRPSKGPVNTDPADNPASGRGAQGASLPEMVLQRVGPLRAGSVSPDGRLLALRAADSDEVTLYEALGGRVLASFMAAQGDVEFSPDGRWVSNGSQIWEVGGNRAVLKPLSELYRNTSTSPAVASASQGSYFAAAWRDRIHLFSSETGQAIWDRERTGDPSFSSDGKSLMIWGTDKLDVLDPATGSSRGHFEHPSKKFEILGASPTGRWLALYGPPPRTRQEGHGGESACPDCGGTLLLADVQLGQSRSLPVPKLTGPPVQVTFDDSETRFVSLHAGADGPEIQVILWSVAEARVVKNLKFEVRRGTRRRGHLCFGPGGKSLIALKEGRLLIWDLETGEAIVDLENVNDFRHSIPLSRFVVAQPQGVRAFEFGGGNGQVREVFRLERFPVGTHAPPTPLDSAEGTVKVFDVSGDGRWMLVSDGGTGLLLADLQSGTHRVLIEPRQPRRERIRTAVAFSSDLRRVGMVYEPGVDCMGNECQADVHVWEVGSRKTWTLAGHRKSPGYRPASRLWLSDDGRYAASWQPSTAGPPPSGGNFDEFLIWEVDSERLLHSSEADVESVAFSHDNRALAWTERTDDKGRVQVKLFDLPSGKETGQIETSAARLRRHSRSRRKVAICFSTDGSLLAVGGEKVGIWKIGGPEQIAEFDWQPGDFLRFSRDGKILLGVGEKTLQSWDTESWEKVDESQWDYFSVANFLVCLSADGRWMAIGSEIDLTFLTVGGEREGGEAAANWRFCGEDSAWSPDERLEAARRGCREVDQRGTRSGLVALQISWDGTLLASFWSDGSLLYWEPRLQKTVAAGYFEAGADWLIRTVEGFVDGTPAALDRVSWRTSPEFSEVQPNSELLEEWRWRGLWEELVSGRPRPLPARHAGVATPRTEWTELGADLNQGDRVSVTLEIRPPEGSPRRGARVVGLSLFRDGYLVGYTDEVPMGDADRVEIEYDVSLPRTGQPSITFTAHAFNSDWAKSPGDRKEFPLPLGIGRRPGRAYVVNVGVSASQNPIWDLEYAANDAKLMQEALQDELASGAAYTEIVPILLISEAEKLGGVRRVTEKSATKSNLRSVLERLADRPLPPGALEGVTNSDLLQPARPEDLVIVSIAGHGRVDDDGEFHFQLYDDTLSSRQLSEWLRGIDAGTMALVVDACQSAATVEREGFRPGPMGSPGLGQLAYDKGILVLAASQVDSLALESDLLKHGLLTYSLVVEGLQGRRADFLPQNGEIDLVEWFQFAERRVPELFGEILAGRYVLPASIVSRVAARGEADAWRPQRPAIFDFRRGFERPPIVISPRAR